jgi:protein-S-isoprenylcysteine O-methyltransferase Ste14
MTEVAEDRARVRVFPPGVPAATILAGVGLQRLWSIPIVVPAPARYWLGGLIVVMAILGFGLRAVVLFRRSGQDENPWKPTPQLVETGPYRVTRNPMYVQMVLVCVGCSIVLSNAWILVLTPLCALVLQQFAILPEEAYLEQKFGNRYLEYKRRVRRWL